MADNTQLSTNVGSGDVVRTEDRAGVKTQIVGLDLNPAGSEVLGTGDATNGLDVDVTRVQGTVTTSATIAAALPAGNNNIGDVDDFGHMHDRNGSRLQFDKVTIAEARPPGVVPHEAVVVKGARWRVLPVAVAAGAVGAGVVELVGRVLA